MTHVHRPVRDMQFVIRELAGLERLTALPGYEESRWNSRTQCFKRPPSLHARCSHR